QPEAVAQKRLKHQPQCCLWCTGRSLGSDVVPVNCQPVRTSEDSIGIETIGFLDKVEQRDFSKFKPLPVKRTAGSPGERIRRSEARLDAGGVKLGCRFRAFRRAVLCWR